MESEKCLWDASDEAYHNKTLRDRGWRNVSESFRNKYSVAELNAKWTNLRIQFRGYAARQKTKSGQGVKETPKWRFYNALKFVGRAEDRQVQGTTSNLDIAMEEENNCEYLLWKVVILYFSKNSIFVFHTTASDIILPPQQKRKTPNPTAHSPASEIVETMREAVSAMKHRYEGALDPNVTFGNYIVSELKTLEKEAAEAVRRKVTVFFLQCLEEVHHKEQL